MGFGLLLVGYFTATIMSINPLGSIFKLLGYFIVCKGAKKLAQYNSTFLFLLYVSVPALIVSGFGAVSDISDFLLLGIFDTALMNTISYLELIFDFLVVVTMCYAIRNISKETGAEKTLYSSVRNLVFYILFMIVEALVLCKSMSPALKNFVDGTALPIWAMILNLVCVILNCLMLFSCYVRICDVDDVEMGPKPSRFAFINKRRKEKWEKHQKDVEDAVEYLETHKSKYSPEQQSRAEAAQRAKKKKRK